MHVVRRRPDSVKSLGQQCCLRYHENRQTTELQYARMGRRAGVWGENTAMADTEPADRKH